MKPPALAARAAKSVRTDTSPRGSRDGLHRGCHGAGRAPGVWTAVLRVPTRQRAERRVGRSRAGSDSVQCSRPYLRGRRAYQSKPFVTFTYLYTTTSSELPPSTQIRRRASAPRESLRSDPGVAELEDGGACAADVSSALVVIDLQRGSRRQRLRSR